MLDFKKRCPIDPEATPAVPPGAMRETFQRAMSNYPQYSPQVWSVAKGLASEKAAARASLPILTGRRLFLTAVTLSPPGRPTGGS